MFRSFLLKAALVSGVVCSMTSSPAYCGDSKSVPAWVIKQTSYNLGDVEITLSKSAMRWHNDKLGLTLLLHAPDWKLNAFNDTNKKFLTLTKEEALEVFQHQRRRNTTSLLEAPLLVTNRPAKIAGMPTVCYCYAHESGNVPEKFALEVTKAVEHGQKLNAAQKAYFDKALAHQRREYWLSTDIAVAPQVSGVFMERSPVTKYGDNLPLRLIQIGKDGSKTTMFDTKTVRRTNVPADLFKMPTGYTKAANRVALLVNDNDFDEFADDSETGSNPKTRKHEDSHR